MTRSWRSYVGGLAAALFVLVAAAPDARTDDRRTDKDRLVPNPAGDENQNESVTIENTSGASVGLTGWKLRDKANTVWALDRESSIAAHQKLEIKRLGRPMGLNNTGDTVELVDPSGAVVDTVTFGRCDEDEVIAH